MRSTTLADALTTMASRALLFVAGASPQIITETVYCLAHEAPASTAVYVLTTETGRDSIAEQLFGRRAYWKRLVHAYPAARRFRFALRNVLVLCDARGAPLADVRSAADNLAAADQIVRFVAERTRDGAPPLHASIAGGRKTMGYLLAAAMMLYGRAEDRLSHVLVYPAELEGTNFFFPPTGRPDAVHSYRGAARRAVKVKAADIRVELADLPFLRLRALHDPAALRQGSFSALVQQTQGDLDALTRPCLEIHATAARVVCSGREVRLRPVGFEIYRLLAERRTRCRERGCPGCSNCFVPAAELTGSYRAELATRMRARESPGVHETKWGGRDFRSEVSKINDALNRALRVASRPFRISSSGERGHLLYGIVLTPEAITFAE